uniref:Annexin n=1 Tax=Strongyloides papillosus TaxID=174720 RepID=A0A0N5BPQ7_STREA
MKREPKTKNLDSPGIRTEKTSKSCNYKYDPYSRPLPAELFNVGYPEPPSMNPLFNNNNENVPHVVQFQPISNFSMNCNYQNFARGTKPTLNSRFSTITSYDPNNSGMYNPFNMSTPWNPNLINMGCHIPVSSIYSQCTTMNQHQKWRIIKTGSATLMNTPNFNSQHDAKMLRVSTTSSKIDKETIINIMFRRTSREKHMIAVQYYNLYNETLASRFKVKIKGKLYKVLKLVMECEIQRNVKDLYKALEKEAIDNAIIIEIFCGKSKQYIMELKELYKEKYGKSIREIIRERTDSGYQRFLLGLVKGERDQGALNLDHVEEDVERLHNDGKGIHKLEDEKFLLDILYKRSFEHINMVINRYQNLVHKDIIRVIKEWFYGDLKVMLLMFFDYLNSPSYYFSKLLKNYLEDFEDNEEEIIRIFLNRAEVDLEIIQQEFNENNSKTLEHQLAASSIGSLRQIFLTMLGHAIDD